MRLIAILLLFYVTDAICQQGNSVALADQGLKAYPIASGIIQYKISGDGDGEASLHFSDWGWSSKLESKYSYSRYGQSTEAHTIELRNGDFLYNAKPKSGKGVVNRDTKLSELLTYKDPVESWEALWMTNGGKKTGTEEILSVSCDVWTFAGGITKRIWVSNGLLYKIEKEIGGLTVIWTATTYSPEVDIPENTYQLNGIDWQ